MRLYDFLNAQARKRAEADFAIQGNRYLTFGDRVAILLYLTAAKPVLSLFFSTTGSLRPSGAISSTMPKIKANMSFRYRYAYGEIRLDARLQTNTWVDFDVLLNVTHTSFEMTYLELN